MTHDRYLAPKPTYADSQLDVHQRFIQIDRQQLVGLDQTGLDYAMTTPQNLLTLITSLHTDKEVDSQQVDPRIGGIDLKMLSVSQLSQPVICTNTNFVMTYPSSLDYIKGRRGGEIIYPSKYSTIHLTYLPLRGLCLVPSYLSNVEIYFFSSFSLTIVNRFQ